MGLTEPTPAFDARMEVLQDRIDQEQAKEIAEIKERGVGERAAAKAERDKPVEFQKWQLAQQGGYKGDFAEWAGKNPTEVSWPGAVKIVDTEFGKQDAMGNIFVSPELQNVRNMAQDLLLEYQQAGDKSPHEAARAAIKDSKKLEAAYWNQLEAAGGDVAREQLIKDGFRSLYGHVPTKKRR